jgi:hypothetical protein
MKRLLLLILALTLLCGCSGDPVNTTPSTEATTLPEPGIYESGHTLETQTNGAVRVYPLAETDGLAFMGKTLVTFTHTGEKTVVTSYSGVNMTQRNSVELDGAVLPGDKFLGIDQQRMGYYNRAENCIIFLDSGLQETGRMEMPQNMVGTPALSENMATAFYCTESEVRAYSLETGINRLIRQQNCQALSVEGVLFEDSVLMCGITGNDGNTYMEFLSAQTGESMGADSNLIALRDWQNQYFLQRQDGLVTEYIFSGADGSQQCFQPLNAFRDVHSLLSMSAVTTVAEDENGVTLEAFDLTDGKRTAQLLLKGVTGVHSLVADPEQNAIWFLVTDAASGKTLLCSWDVERSPVADTKTYTKPRYTLENPDTDALAACYEKADALEQRFGVEITFVKEPLESDDYGLIYEHQPAVILNALEQLEQAMSIFPEGFFQTAAEISDSRKLHIGLVRGLNRKNTGVPEGVDALQYWVDGNAWMALSVGDTVQEQFIHELAHLLDTFVYSKNVAYDEWSKLNPKDFAYDLSYFQYEAHSDSKYLSGKEQAFVDTYSMTYPKEDRARIFDCALAEGNEELFASKTMQSKLRQLCVGIRNAFGWKKDSRTFPWEQYLETPLAYNKK